MACNVEGAALAVEALSWGPTPRQTIISNVSFSAPPGVMVAIVGPNGAGKSSLLRCLFRASRPTAGTVRLDGEDIWRMKPRQVARRVAAVLQELPADFDFLVEDVVMMGRTPHREGMAGWSVEDRAEVAHALEHMKLEPLARRSFASLSGGEKQRVQIARALAQEPRLIILDEPTNHLDIRHQLEILALLKGLGMTVVTTLHDIGLAARFADTVVVMKQGRVVADGLPHNALHAVTIRDVFGVESHLGATADGHRHFDFTLPAIT